MGKGNIQGFGESFLPVGAWKVGFLHLPKIQVYGSSSVALLIAALMLFYEKNKNGSGDEGCP